MDLGSPSGSSVHGISQARILNGFSYPPPGIFSTQGSNPRLLHRQADSLPLSQQGSPIYSLTRGKIHSQIMNYSMTNIARQLWSQKKKKNSRQTSLVVQRIIFHLPLQGVGVQSLVRKLRHSMSPGQNTKTKQKQCFNTFNKCFKNGPYQKKKEKKT